MNITRNNYEEFFLLYADGELNTAERQAVENFVKLHPDLAEELEMLMDTILAEDRVTMPGKELLLKQETVFDEIITPQQETMLMLLDNELEKSKANKLLEEIESNKELLKEWNMLQQTKLPRVDVTMPNKEELYRHEPDRKPIPITWVKWVAAAAIIAGIGWFGLNFFSNSKSGSATEVATNSNNHAVKPAEKMVIVNAPATRNTNAKSEIAKSVIAVKPIKSTPNNTSIALKPKPVQVNNKQEQPVVYEKQPVQLAVNNNRPAPEIQNEPKNETKTLAGIDASGTKNPIVNTTNNPEEVPAVAENTLYKEDAFNDDTEYVSIAGARIKKQKLRGVFRNVTRTIGRTFDKSNVAQADMASLR